MKKLIFALAVLTVVLFAGCAKIFDGLIETVYKDKLKGNAFGMNSIDVHLRIGNDWTQADKNMGVLKLAMVPLLQGSSGVIPDWSKKVITELDWNNFHTDPNNPNNKVLDSSVSADTSFSYKLIVYQDTHANNTITATDTAMVMMFFFKNGTGSDDTLTPDNINSEPYADGFISVASRLPTYLIDLFSGANQGGASASFSVTGPGTVDTVYLSTYQTFYVYRYGSSLKPVANIEYRRQLLDASKTPLQKSGEQDPISYPVGDAYSGNYSFSAAFDNLYQNGVTPFTPTAGMSIQVAIRLKFTDGTTSPYETADISFWSSGNTVIGVSQPFQINISVDRWDDSQFWGRPFEVQLYDENWGSAGTYTGTTNGSGYWNLTAIGGTHYSTQSGGRYKAYVIVDTNMDGIVDGNYNGGYVYQYDQYAYISDIVAYDNTWNGSAYQSYATADSTMYWYNW